MGTKSKMLDIHAPYLMGLIPSAPNFKMQKQLSNYFDIKKIELSQEIIEVITKEQLGRRRK